MNKVITYGTFDLLHYGHINLLKRAKALGDYLIVGVTSDSYDLERGKLNVQQSLLQRIDNVRETGFADEIIVEEFEGQKISDIQKMGINTFVIGSDWEGKFDYLKEYCDVVYLERTRGISSTALRQKDYDIVSIGIIGSGRIAKRFVKESKYVSGVNIEGVYNPNITSAQRFKEQEELQFSTDNLKDFFSMISAVYIASPHQTHFGYIMEALKAGKHVLCEKPLTLTKQETMLAYEYAHNEKLVLLEGIKTAYCPAFKHMLLLAKSGRIGNIKDIEASFTKLVAGNIRELRADMSGGSINELSSYVLLPIVKLLGTEYKKLEFYSYMQNQIDAFTKGLLYYNNATASFKVGLGCKTEGNLIITGTSGYIYVPAPWWKTEYFEMRFEKPENTTKYFYKFEGDVLRYELLEFISLINKKQNYSQHLTSNESIFISSCIDKFRQGQNVNII